jgi:hypothetical protein
LVCIRVYGKITHTLPDFRKLLAPIAFFMQVPKRIGKYPTSDYIAAFCNYAECEESQIQIKRLEGHAVVLHKGSTYMVSAYDDLVSDYRAYFEGGNYGEIYTQTHEGVFAEMLKEDVEITAGELIIGIFAHWQSYWEEHKQEVNGEALYQRLRQKSWEELLILIETIKVEPLEVVRHGSALDLIFVPMIAYVIRDHYKDPEEFYQDAINILIENGENWLTMGGTFESVFLGEEDDDDSKAFYIYNPIIEFQDLEEELAN